MQNPAPSWNEAERSAALHSYGVLDTPREEEFDDLAQIAAEVCGTPIAVVNLVDTARQFFKAEVGLGVRETPLETSFCGQAILAEEMMIVPDATKDPRFDCNPLVTTDPGLRFYAGALLKTRDGLPIGTVCVLDYRPRDLDEHQIRTLRLLARQAMTQLELRKSLLERDRSLEISKRAEADFRAMSDDAPAILWVTDCTGRCTYLNRAWYAFSGQTKEEAEGFGWLDATHPDDKEKAGEIFLAANAERRAFSLEYRLRHRDGAYRWAIDSGSPRFDSSGNFLGYVGTVLDIDGLRKAERLQQVAMREMSHRMKNSLAMVQAITTQSIRHASSLEDAAASISSRISALSQAQDLLTRPDLSDSTVGEVVAKAMAPHDDGKGRVEASGSRIVLSSDQAVGLVLALHELATNAVKYGALSTPGGRVRISWGDTHGGFGFEWSESGGPVVAEPTRKGFGSRLLDRIVPSYFEGSAIRSFEPHGARYVLNGMIRQDVKA